MSRKRRGDQAVAAEPDPDLIRHIRSLGLQTVAEYRRWCADNGFGRGLQKHWRVRCRERAHATRSVADARLLQKKQERRRPDQVIRKICNGDLTERDVTQPELLAICRAVAGQKKHTIDRRILTPLLLHVQSRANLLTPQPVIERFGHQAGNTYAEALARVAAHRRWWLRPLADWKPRTRNARRQFASLLRHLFARYDVPQFFDSAWFAGSGGDAYRQQCWYVQVARGTNIRRCDLPIPYTKKMSHYFMQAPSDLTVNEALRWGQVHALGGDARLARALLGTRIGQTFEHDDFWITVVRWFIGQAMLDTESYGPIIDYVQHQRFGPRPAAQIRVRHDDPPPPEPNLTMNGRTADSLLRQVTAWHRRLAGDNTYQISEWRPSGIDAFEFLEGAEQSQNLKCWTIRELLSSRALFAEGRKMKHCVATYASSCARGASSIWTLEIESFEGRAKVLTIEVRNAARQICQVRGKANRSATDKERAILRRWATKAGLTIASYV